MEKNLTLFLNNPNTNKATLDSRRQCDAEGHKPYVEDGQSMDGKIHGCYCGWVKLKEPIYPEIKLPNWIELSKEAFHRH